MGKNIKIIAAEEIIRDQRVIKEAKYISELGYNVEILCWDREGEFIDKEIEFVGSVRIKRFFPRSIYGSGWKQIVPYIKFIIETKKYLKNKDYHYLHCQNLDGFIAGYFINRKAKLIFDMREFYEGRERNKIKRFLIRKMLGFANKISWNVIYVNDTQIKGMREQYKSKLVYLPNYPNRSLGEHTKKEKSNSLNIFYIGSVRQYKIFENLFKAIKGMNRVTVSIYGDGVAYKALKQIEREYENVKIAGKYDPIETPRLYSRADIIYCVYSMSNLNWRTAYPIKFYESIITKTSVIVSKGSVLEEFLNKHDIGFVVDGEDIQGIRELINYILNNKYVLEEKVKNIEEIQFDYCWESVVKNLDEIYNNS